MVEPTPALIPLTTPGPEREASCFVWGDPHARVFDSMDSTEASAPAQSIVNIFSHGDFWVVKGAQIHIQGRYGATVWAVSGLSATRALAIGGPFLQGHTLLIEPKDGRVTWDGKEILQEMPSGWTAPGVASAYVYEA